MRGLGPALVCLFGFSVQVYTLAFHETLHVEAKGDHRVLLEEFGRGVPIAQTFTMQNAGLQGISIRVAAAERGDVTFDWLLSERGQTETFVPLYGNRQQVRNVSGDTWATIRFPSIAQSIGRTYQLDLHVSGLQSPDGSRSPGPAAGSAGLVASLDDAMAGGALFVGGEERWGDLVFDTIAAGDTILGRFMVTRAAVRIFQLGAAIVVYDILFAAFVMHFWPRTRTAPREPSAGFRPGIGQVVVAGCLVAAAVGAYISRGPRPAVDLIDTFYAADLRSSMRMHDAFSLTEALIGGESMPAIAAHPTSEIAWQVTIPPRARLRAAMATDPFVWSKPGDGLVFRIVVSDEGHDSELFVRHLDPARVPADRRWVPVDIDLSRFSGRRIRLIFKTDPSLPGRAPNADHDWARWGAPRIFIE